MSITMTSAHWLDLFAHFMSLSLLAVGGEPRAREQQHVAQQVVEAASPATHHVDRRHPVEPSGHAAPWCLPSLPTRRQRDTPPQNSSELTPRDTRTAPWSARWRRRMP